MIASVSFELTEDAFQRGGGIPLAVGLALGAVTYFVGDLAIDRIGPTGARGDTGLALLMGAALTASPSH